MVELADRGTAQHVPGRDLANLLGDTPLGFLKPFASICLFAFQSSGACADASDAVSEFRRLCVMEEFLHDPTTQPPGFPHAQTIWLGSLEYGLPPESDPEFLASWDLRPDAFGGGGLAVSAVNVTHPTMGRMSGCLMLIERGLGGALDDRLIAMGGEREGQFIYMMTATETWMIRASMAGPKGESIILGFKVP